jgi:hypothetical protein
VQPAVELQSATALERHSELLVYRRERRDLHTDPTERGKNTTLFRC